MTNQSKRSSLLEAVINTGVALIINLLITPVVNAVCSIEMDKEQILISTFLFTFISIVRSYVLRRIFEKYK